MKEKQRERQTSKKTHTHTHNRIPSPGQQVVHHQLGLQHLFPPNKVTHDQKHPRTESE